MTKYFETALAPLQRGCPTVYSWRIASKFRLRLAGNFTFRVRRSRGEMYMITAVCVSVCVFLAAFPHYCTDRDVSWGMVGVLSSCALLGGFAIGARVSLL